MITISAHDLEQYGIQQGSNTITFMSRIFIPWQTFSRRLLAEAKGLGTACQNKGHTCLLIDYGSHVTIWQEQFAVAPPPIAPDGYPRVGSAPTALEPHSPGGNQIAQGGRMAEWIGDEERDGVAQPPLQSHRDCSPRLAEDGARGVSQDMSLPSDGPQPRLPLEELIQKLDELDQRLNALDQAMPAAADPWAWRSPQMQAGE